MASRRWGTLAAGIALAIFVAALGSAGLAGAEVVSNPPEEECNPDGRLFCIDVDTFQGITASDPTRPITGNRYTWVEWTMSNDGGSTLTHPTVTVTLADYDCSELETEVLDPETECDSLRQTSAFVGTATPDLCDVSPASLTCTYANLPAGGDAPTTRVFFKTAELPATHTVISVEGTVNERANDQNPCEESDPNCDTFEASVLNSYEARPGEAETFALPGGTFYLDTDDTLGSSGDGASSFTFASGSPATFRANFRANTSACTVVTCFQRELITDIDGPAAYNSGPVLFYARVTNPPPGVNQNNLIAIHSYDPVEVVAAGNVFTPPTGYSFAGITKVTLTPPGTEFFVVNYNSTANTFQLSLTSGGLVASFADGTYDATPAPQVIGDVSTERWTSPGVGGCTFAPDPPIVSPSICVKRVQGLQQTFDVWVRDSRNGLIKLGP